MIFPNTPTITSLNGKVYTNEPFNGETATTLDKSDDLIFDNFDKTTYYSLIINLTNRGKVIWFFATVLERDNEYIRLLSEIPENGGGTGNQPSIVGTYELDLSTTSTLTIAGTNFSTSTAWDVVGGSGLVTIDLVNFISDTQVELTLTSDINTSIYTITATNGALTSLETDNLNVRTQDAIFRALSGQSLINYNLALAGEWVSITESEWNNLLVEVANVQSFGTSDTDLKTGVFGNFAGGAQFTFGQTTNPSTSGQFVFAFKCGIGQPIIGGDDLVRISNNGVTNWLQLGNALPGGAVFNNVQYYVLKSSSLPTPTPSYVGLTTNSTGAMYFDVDNTNGLRAFGSTDNPNLAGFGWSLQCLGTNIIQWTI